MAIFSEISENESVKKAPPVKSDNLIDCAITGKRCETGCTVKLVLFTNRKSHAGFRLVRKSVT